MVCLPPLECSTLSTAPSPPPCTEINSFQTVHYKDCFIVIPAQVQWQFSCPGVLLDWVPFLVYWGNAIPWKGTKAYFPCSAQRAITLALAAWGGEKKRGSALSIWPSSTLFQTPAAGWSQARCILPQPTFWEVVPWKRQIHVNNQEMWWKGLTDVGNLLYLQTVEGGAPTETCTQSSTESLLVFRARRWGHVSHVGPWTLGMLPPTFTTLLASIFMEAEIKLCSPSACLVTMSDPRLLCLKGIRSPSLLLV